MNILQVCAYAAPYEGNFMKSLYALDKRLTQMGHSTVYAFCEYAKDKEWVKLLQKRRKVYFLPQRFARINPLTYIQLRNIIKKENIELVHSHFELYDLPLGAVTPRGCKLFWHLHDPIILESRKSRNLLYKLQYRFFGKHATLFSVCDYYKETAIRFGFNADKAVTILNGIDLGRVSYPYIQEKCVDFLTFGWDFYRKGSDIIFRALEKLAENGYSFRFIFNCNNQTLSAVDTYFGNNKPSWLEIGKPVEDINELFAVSRVFIQASRRETFSYAVCEAAYAGLDVISSDIYGLEWAHTIPGVSFFESENVEQLYRMLKKRLDNQFYFPTSVVESSRRIIEECFSVQVWVSRVIEQYNVQ